MANMTFGVNIIPKANANVTLGNSDNPWSITSPVLTGTPTAPTAEAGTNTTQIATTAFVQTAVSGGVGSGDVTGPNSSTDGNVVLFDGATGKVIKDSGKTLGVSVPADAVFTDTTYESKSAASGGTAVSLCTTGEKYTWNNKSNLTIGTTASTAAAGNHTHTLSIATNSGTNELTLAASTKYKLTAGGDSYIFTTPPNTTYSAGACITLDGTTFKMVKADVNDAINLLSTGATDATADTYLVGCYDSTSSTDFTRRKASTVVNATLVKAALGTDGSTTTKCLTQKGTWATFGTSNLAIGTSSTTAAAGDHTHGTLTMNRTSTGNWLNLQGNSTQVGRLYWGTAGAAGTEGFSILQLGNATAKTAANNASGQLRLYNSNGGYARMTGTYGTLGGSNEDYINVPEQLKAAKVWGAVWNDYAEMRKCKTIEAGRCVTETISGEMELTEGRLQAGCRIISDTYGFCIGETAEAKIPIAVCGRVLAYPYKDPSGYHLGDAVCSAPNGTVDIMTREEIKEYPERIIGTISEIPKYDTWNAGSEENPMSVPVNGRIWIYVR